MVPTPIYTASRSSRLLYVTTSLVVQNVPKLFSRLFLGHKPFKLDTGDRFLSALRKRAEKAHGGELIAFGILIPVLVLLSGLFAGLTLGYMSLDETQLHVLSISGTP